MCKGHTPIHIGKISPINFLNKVTIKLLKNYPLKKSGIVHTEVESSYQNMGILMGTEEYAIWEILATVADPEIPVLAVTDLGIIRNIHLVNEITKVEKLVEITITPTYSGCPAMDMIAINIKMALLENGYTKIKITSVLSPAWTTDWITTAGKQKLYDYGIAPPKLLSERDKQQGFIDCPQCQSTNTKMLSEFGSTACKSLYQCQDCKEPFDYFKCH